MTRRRLLATNLVAVLLFAGRAALAGEPDVDPRPKLVILPPLTPIDGLEVTRDGTVVDPATLGNLVPVDPGRHVVAARAPSRSPWSTTVDVAEATEKVEVRIPDLEPALLEAQRVPGPHPTEEQPTVAVPLPHVAPPTNSRRTAGIALAVAGGVAVLASFAVGLAASVQYDHTDNGVDCVDNRCTSLGLDNRQNAFRTASVATVLVVAGSVIGAGGLVLWLTAPKDPAPAPASGIALGPTSLSLVRSW